jgi:hypothetical protein
MVGQVISLPRTTASPAPPGGPASAVPPSATPAPTSTPAPVPAPLAATAVAAASSSLSINTAASVTEPVLSALTVGGTAASEGSGGQRTLAPPSEDDLGTALRRALRAMDVLLHLFERARETCGPLVPANSSSSLSPPPPTSTAVGLQGARLAPPDFFRAYWLPVLTGLSANASHPVRAIRLHALASLQRLLIVPELALLPPAELTVCFNEVRGCLCASVPVMVAQADVGAPLSVRVRLCMCVCVCAGPVSADGGFAATRAFPARCAQR